MSDIVAIMSEVRPYASEQLDNNLSDASPAQVDRLKLALVGKDTDEIARASGVSPRSIRRALKGIGVKRSTLVALAVASGVRTEWLVDGAGDMRAAAPLMGDPGPHLPAPEPKKPPMFEWADMQRLADALEVADVNIRTRGGVMPYAQKAQVLALIYDMLGTTTPDKVQRIIDVGAATNDPP